MASLPSRELKIGKIIDKTLGVLEHSATGALIYLAAFALINSAVTYFTLDASPMQGVIAYLATVVASIAGAYFLLEFMVRRTGLRSRTDEDVFLPFFGLSILYTLGVGLGFILLVIPGVFVMIRWSIAQPFLVARGEGVMKSLGESWERTRGNEFPILAAALTLIALLLAIIIACSLLFERENIAGIVISQLATSATSVVSLAMGVALYGLIVGGKDVASTFE